MRHHILRAVVLLLLTSTTVVVWSVTATSQTDVAPAAWERRVDGGFENLGVARVERFGDRWMLTILCGQSHSTYLETPPSDISEQIDRYVRAQYHYVDRQVTDIRCIQAPCTGVTERRIALDRLERLTLTDEQATTISRDCGATIRK